MTSKCGILIVDDNFELCACLADILEDEGYKVCTANSGEQAVEIGAGDEFDIVFIDVKLPGMNGFEVLEHLKKKSLNTVFILISAFANDKIYSKIMQEGNFEVIHKPFNMDDFMKRVHSICNSRKKRPM